MSAFKAPDLAVDLSGQVALVTGASSGLGRRFAEIADFDAKTQPK